MKKATYTHEPLGDLEAIADFLPPPAELAFREEGIKVTLALSRKTVDFFKAEAAKHQTQHQVMIRRLLDAYVDAQDPSPWLVSQSGQPASGQRHSCSLSKEFAEMPPTA